MNRILAALPAVEFASLERDLEFVHFARGAPVYKSGESPEFAYFPTTCIVSLMSSARDGSATELAMTGKDGLVGIQLVLGGTTTTYDATVQSEGGAYRLRAPVLRWELDQCRNLRHESLGYAQALMTQMAQNAVCIRHHRIEQQLCRWLLCSLDLRNGNTIDITQELIARLLGVRREAITLAAGALQSAGLIQNRRGHIAVIDRLGLQERVCECYRSAKLEQERLFARQPLAFGISRPRLRPDPACLRERAEARLTNQQQSMPTEPMVDQRLLHELQVHRIELEMQNEELQQAYSEADRLRQRYADIFDFAPVGYFSLDSAGFIIDVNLEGAIQLGIKRSEHVRFRFDAFVQPGSRASFENFRNQVLAVCCKQKCEIALAANKHRPAIFVRIEAIPDESGEECRMVVSDITAELAARAKGAVAKRSQRVSNSDRGARPALVIVDDRRKERALHYRRLSS